MKSVRKSMFVRLLWLQICLFLIALDVNAESRLAMVLSGGVSLGSYESGYIETLSKTFKAQNMKLGIVTGASAGSVNGMVAILNMCAVDGTGEGMESLNWKIWGSLGLNEMIKLDKVTPISMFDRESARPSTNLIKKFFLKGLKKDCEVIYGVALTRKEPLRVELADDLHGYRFEEFFVFKIKGLGAGRAPQIENFPLNISGKNQLFLPLGLDQVSNYELMEQVFYASAQFPLAFPPYTIKHCDLDSTSSASKIKESCHAKTKLIKTEFIDGGMFENTPLKLAGVIDRNMVEDRSLSPSKFLVVTLSGTTFPEDDSDNGGYQSSDSFVNYGTHLFGNFMEVSRKKSLIQFYEEYPPVKNIKQVFSNQKIFPRASDYFYAFSGFLDQGFREYDYVLGQYEAEYFLEANYRYFGLPAVEEDLRLRCFRSMDLNESCLESVKDENFKKIFIANKRLLEERCRRYPLEAKRYPSCNRVLISNNTLGSPSEDKASSTKLFFSSLDAQKYQYEYSQNPEQTGFQILRSKLDPMIKQLAMLQPENQKQVFAMGGEKLVLDSLAYHPSDDRFVVSLGTHFQIHKNYLLKESAKDPWYFVGYGVAFRDLEKVFSRNPSFLIAMPFVSLVSQWTLKDYFWLQPEYGLRFGYNKPFHAEAECFSSNKWMPYSQCESPIIQPFFALGVLKKIRFELGYVRYTRQLDHTDVTGLIQFEWSH